MRCYLPISAGVLKDFSNPTVASADFTPTWVWADSTELREALPEPGWDSEEYEDLAITLASFYSLLVGDEQVNTLGRLVLAVDLPDKQISMPTNRPFAAFALNFPVSWKQVVSIHFDSPDLAMTAARLQPQLNESDWEYLLFSEANDASAESIKRFGDNAEKIATDWEELLNESLQWWDVEERELIVNRYLAED